VGGKCVYVVLNMMSVIMLKLILKNGGCVGYCGLFEVVKGVCGVKLKVVCDVLIFDEELCFDIYLYICIDENEVDIGYEVMVLKIGEE